MLVALRGMLAVRCPYCDAFRMFMEAAEINKKENDGALGDNLEGFFVHMIDVHGRASADRAVECLSKELGLWKRAYEESYGKLVALMQEERRHAKIVQKL